LAIAKEFVEQGAFIYALDIKNGGDYSEGTSFIKSDLSKEEDWSASILQVLEEQGRIDILVNNADVISYTPIHELVIDGGYTAQ